MPTTLLLRWPNVAVGPACLNEVKTKETSTPPRSQRFFFLKTDTSLSRSFWSVAKLSSAPSWKVNFVSPNLYLCSIFAFFEDPIALRTAMLNSLFLHFKLVWFGYLDWGFVLTTILQYCILEKLVSLFLFIYYKKIN